jgi:outer membrane receptor protein involved in Fe transport
VDAKITNNGKAVTDVGQVPVGVPVDQGSLSTTYRGLGGVRGLSLHVNLSYVGQAYPFSTQTTFQRNIVAPSYALLNPGVSYSWKEGAHHLKQSIRVSAKNVLNRDYVTSKYELGTKRGFYFAYSLDH